MALTPGLAAAGSRGLFRIRRDCGALMIGPAMTTVCSCSAVGGCGAGVKASSALDERSYSDDCHIEDAELPRLNYFRNTGVCWELAQVEEWLLAFEEINQTHDR